jgi:hypothetical protein
VVQYGQTSLGSLEERLAAAGRHNLQAGGGDGGGCLCMGGALVGFVCRLRGCARPSVPLATRYGSGGPLCAGSWHSGRHPAAAASSICVQELMHVADSLRAAGQSGWQELSSVVENAAERIRCAAAAPQPACSAVL